MNLINKYLCDFKEYRNDYLDDLPLEHVSLFDPNYYKYKCRWNFMVSVSSRISLLISRNLISNPFLVKEWTKFNEYIKNRWWIRFTTKEEIDMVNIILDLFIDELSKKVDST